MENGCIQQFSILKSIVELLKPKTCCLACLQKTKIARMRDFLIPAQILAIVNVKEHYIFLSMFLFIIVII